MPSRAFGLAQPRQTCERRIAKEPGDANTDLCRDDSGLTQKSLGAQLDVLRNCVASLFVIKLYVSGRQGWGRSSVGRASRSQ